MANINFPNNPVQDDIFTVGGKTYTYDGVKWVANTTITKTDVGLENVQNYGVASQAEAEAGALDNKYMTPLKTAQAIAALAEHETVTAASSVDNSTNDNYIKSLTFDNYGHVTSVTSAEVGGGVLVSDTEPASPSAGDLWFDSVNYELYVGTGGEQLTVVEPPSGSPANTFFGVSIDTDGTYIAIGAPEFRETPESNQGSVFIYDANTFEFVKRIDANLSSGRFGHSVSVNNGELLACYRFADTVVLIDIETENVLHTFNDGTENYGSNDIVLTDSTIIIPEYNFNVSGKRDDGKVWVYNRSDYTIKAELLNPDSYPGAEFDRFGTHVSADDNYILVGVPAEDGSDGSGVGVVYVFANNGSTSPTRTISNPGFSGLNKSGDSFSRGVRLDGTNAYIGAYGVDNIEDNSGVVYQYDIINGNLIRTFENPNAFGTPGFDYFGWRITTDNEKLYISATREDSNGINDSGIIYVYEKSTGNFISQYTDPNIYNETTKNEFGGYANNHSAFDGKLFTGAHESNGGRGVAYFFDTNSPPKWKKLT